MQRTGPSRGGNGTRVFSGAHVNHESRSGKPIPDGMTPLDELALERSIEPPSAQHPWVVTVVVKIAVGAQLPR